MTASNIHYEIADRTRATAPAASASCTCWCGTRLDQAINRYLGLLKIHLPYHDSDHVLNIAYNLLAGGTCWNTWNCSAATSLPRRPGGPPHPRPDHGR